MPTMVTRMERHHHTLCIPRSVITSINLVLRSLAAHPHSMAALLTSSAYMGTALQARAPAARPQTAAAYMPVRASQSLQGKVVSTAQSKTAVVEVATLQIHPVYQGIRRAWAQCGMLHARNAGLARDGPPGRRPPLPPTAAAPSLPVDRSRLICCRRSACV